MTTYKKICDNCRWVVAGELTKEEQQRFYTKGRVVIKCHHCQSPITVGFDGAGADSAVEEPKFPPAPSLPETSPATRPPDSAPPWSLAEEPRPTYDQAFEELPVQQDAPPPFEPISRDGPQRPSNQRGTSWQRFYVWFSRQPAWKQGSILACLFALALGILLMPSGSGKPKQKTEDSRTKKSAKPDVSEEPEEGAGTKSDPHPRDGDR